MPLYEYACAKCGEIEEVMQKISDPPPAKCPKCGARKMERVISRSSFQLKGGGWYSEGYASGGKKSSESKSESTTTATTEAKPAAKSETKAAPNPSPKAEAKAPAPAKASAKKD